MMLCRTYIIDDNHEVLIFDEQVRILEQYHYDLPQNFDINKKYEVMVSVFSSSKTRSKMKKSIKFSFPFIFAELPCCFGRGFCLRAYKYCTVRVRTCSNNPPLD